MTFYRIKLKKKFSEFIERRSLVDYWYITRNIHLVIAKYINVFVMTLVFFINPNIHSNWFIPFLKKT